MNRFKLFSVRQTQDTRQVLSLNDHIENSQVLGMTQNTKRLCLLVLYASQAKQNMLDQDLKDQRQLSIIPGVLKSSDSC